MQIKIFCTIVIFLILSCGVAGNEFRLPEDNDTQKITVEEDGEPTEYELIVIKPNLDEQGEDVTEEFFPKKEPTQKNKQENTSAKENNKSDNTNKIGDFHKEYKTRMAILEEEAKALIAEEVKKENEYKATLKKANSLNLKAGEAKSKLNRLRIEANTAEEDEIEEISEKLRKQIAYYKKLSHPLVSLNTKLEIQSREIALVKKKVKVNQESIAALQQDYQKKMGKIPK